MTEDLKKLQVEIDEIIDQQSDVILRLAWLHIKSALLAFQNTNISHEDAYLRYEKLIKMCYKILKSANSNDNDLTTEDKTIDEIIRELIKLLLTKRRKLVLDITI